jgi:hypothetical protein
VFTVHGDLLWCDGGWPGSCHEHVLLPLSGWSGVLDGVEVASLLDRGFHGLAKTRALACPRRGPPYQRPPHRRPSGVQPPAGRLRALVEQAIAHLTSAWSPRRWRGLLYRVRDVSRATGALVCLGRWLHRVPHNKEHHGHPQYHRSEDSGHRIGPGRQRHW